MTAASLSRPAEEYLSWLAVEKGRSPHTIAAYRRDLASYEAALRAAGTKPEGTGSSQVATYVAGLRRSGMSPSSTARALSSIRGLHRFLLREGFAPSDPTADIGATGPAGRLPKALDEDQVRALLDSVGGGEPRDRRDRALLELLYATGARISEVVALDLTDLPTPGSSAGSPEAEGGRPLLRLLGKGSRERLVPVGRVAEAALAAWLSPGGRDRMAPDRWPSRADAEAVFVNTRGRRLTRQSAFHVVQGRARAAGIGGTVSPHVLRHSCATHMLAHGADVRVVQELLGHVSVATTQLYTKVSPEHLRAAYELAHPRAAPPRP